MDLAEYLRFFLALGFVLVLIAILAALVRRSGLGDRLAVAKTTTGRRLDLVEVRPLDAKRKLVLLRRDDREHLVLLGSGSDLLIESDIPAPPRPAAETTETTAMPQSRGETSTFANRMMAKLRGTPA